MIVYAQTKECPQCKRTSMWEEEHLNSLSRRDNETYICNDCGLKEALSDLRAHIQWDKGERV